MGGVDTRRVMALLREGMAPSRIDAELGFVPGTARAEVAYQWALDKEEHKKERTKGASG